LQSDNLMSNRDKDVQRQRICITERESADVLCHAALHAEGII